MIVLNIKGILANDEENTELKEEIETNFKDFPKLKLKKVKVIKMSSYYSVFLQVKVDENISIKKYIELEKKLKSQLKSKNRLIRFIDIEPV